MTDILEKNVKFASAAKYCAENVATFSNEELLELYGYYKQATVGDSPNSGSSSVFSVFSLKDKAKAKSWAEKKGISPEDAAERYIKLIDKKNPEWEATIGKGALETSLSNSASIPVVASPDDKEIEEIDIESKGIINDALLNPNFNESNCSNVIFDAFCSQVNNNSTNYIKDVLEKFQFLSRSTSSEGSTALHYACDRGYIELSTLLLKYGADPNGRDKFGDTPLHISATRDNLECVKLLLNYGADPFKVNDDNLTPKDVADKTEIISLLSSSR
ncbi:hypothetical protein FG386_001198 [Cryptosporidium ryanae]|uniref:uncharacterized protein n=1 Tax=Cryptosporidium ryanae TaxID=515981 RepID=UPI00351A3B39|nr:hypothetical protein FG386_001198 [Cryptosporidium ryanae]